MHAKYEVSTSYGSKVMAKVKVLFWLQTYTQTDKGQGHSMVALERYIIMEHVCKI